MNRTRHYIRTLLLMLLLMGGSIHEAWAATVTKKITYHVITLPFGSAELTGGTDAAHTFRIEAIKKEVTYTYDDSGTIPVIELPAEFKSPLMTNDAYTYYYTGNSGVTITASQKIFPNNPLLFNTYAFDTDKALAANATLTALGAVTDVYVTYDWVNKKSLIGNVLKLDGSELYNIEFVYKNNGTEKHEFFAMNMNSERGNRAQAIPFEDIKDPSDLTTDGPHKLIDGKTDETKTDFHYTWLLLNDDPYNIFLETAYAKDDPDWGPFIYKENNIPKKSKRARFYGRVNSDTSVESNSWMNNEWGYGWYTGSGETPERTNMPGWFRGTNQTGIGINGVQDKGLYFSFALLNRTNAGNDYTLVAVCANTNATTWVPNDNGNYLHLGRKIGKYPGPSYSSFADADKVILHDIKMYTFKVKTPFNTVLSHEILVSEHYDPYNVLDFIPDALKRKYVTFEGAYKTEELDGVENNTLTTFASVDAAKNGGVIWLKYSTEMPFEAGNANTEFAKLKWYNFYADKNTNYTVWYDTTSDAPNTFFSTHTGHSKYSHDSHFAFIGDPFELYVISREASEVDSNTPHYLELAITASDPLTTGTSRAVGNKWEIEYDDDKNNNKDCFRLRKFGTYENPLYIGWKKTGTFPLNGNEDALRLYIEPLPLMDYTYYIVNLSGEVAVKATAEQMTGIALGSETIPNEIKSPFLNGATLKFYNFNSKDDFDARTLANKTEIFTTNSDQGDANEYKNHILVYYSGLQSAYTDLINGTTAADYNVILNNEYIYYEANTIKSNTSIVGVSTDAKNLWTLGGSDPYRMTIKNKGADKYVSVPNWAAGALDWSSDVPASKFIIKAGTSPGTYEVMAATGWDVDAHEDTYYNIGRPERNTVRMYSKDDYDHGYQQIMFQLKKSSAKQIIYHLIDKSNNLLLSENARQAREEEPHIPAEYFCPLVEKYTYWKSDPRVSGAVAFEDNQKFQDVFTDYEWTNTAGHESEYKENIDIWITYTTSDEIDLKHTTMYLLKFFQGDEFNQEDGSDGLTSSKIQAVYPYCNGDGNLNIYGQTMYEDQQAGAANTRTRWAWYIESSGDNDPYHVRILSRQTETYNGLDRSAYFATMKFDGYDKVITTLVWPNISGVQSTDYMILGTDHQYQLVTTEKIDGKRYVVDSFEQYWKTYDTIKKKLLKDLLDLCEEKERTDRIDGSVEVPTTPASLRERLTGTGEGQYGFHSYQKMAYAKRWNGYNADGANKKGWETKEHWFQTVKMGSGYFDLIPTTIDPALILLDQHGWEIMRKPLPSGPDDPKKEEKYDVLRQYDSPMVKEYIFWASAKKRSGYHQYYLMDQRIGGDFTSTSLTSLPPYDSENVKDTKGNQNDQYVTYIVKDEYVKSYVPGTTPTAYPFLIRQGDLLAKKGATGNAINVEGNAGVSQYIIDHVNTLSDELWYVRPNTEIDREMGYPAAHPDWKDNPNAYEDENYRNYPVADFIEGESDDPTVKKYGHFTFSNGFDPYNIQICSQTGGKYFTTGMTGAEVGGGSVEGKYGSLAVTLADKNTTPVSGNSYDGSHFNMTNQTYMAVQGADGEIQLMPRFDHNMRMQEFGTLVTPESSAVDEKKLEKTYTKFYRPYVYNYLIVDNSGHESLRYSSGGDLLPQTPDHLKSPLAKDFKYYSNLTASAGIYQLTNIDSKEIKESLAGAGLTTPSVTNSNYVYVRYAYNKDADDQFILKGKWLSMKLNDLDAIYNNGIKQFNTEGGTKTKPAPVVGKTNRDWQWKFLKHPYSDPDPYAVQVFNRLSDNQDKPMSVLTASMDGGIVQAQTDGAAGYLQHFALLSHSDLNGDGKADTYALALARTGAYTYPFLNGYNMSTANGAIIKEDKTDYTSPSAKSGFTSTTANFHATDTRVQLFDDVTNDYTYKIYTNEHTEAVTAEQTHEEVEALDNGYEPTLPEGVRSLLLKLDQYRYYEAVGDLDDESKELETLYGLYDGDVYVRYTYDPTKTEYKVPNERNSTSAPQVDRGEHSNDSPLKFGEKMLYNFIWYDDNMMKSNSGGTGVESVADHVLEYSDKNYEWQLFGDDPYAIQIKNRGAEKYIDASCGLSTTPQTFMLLSKEGYENGVLAKTGNKDAMLSLDGSTLSTTATPNHFMIFALSTLRVVYHLTISNIGSYETIPYRKGARATKDDPDTYSWNEKEKGYKVGYDAATDTLHVMGTTKRDLTSQVNGVAGDKYQLGATVSYPNYSTRELSDKTYCKDFGPISLGDALTVPTEFYRPNVVYSFVIHDIQGDEGALNNKYKGMEIKSKEMGLDEDLIGKTLYINIVYGFDDDLESNSGDNFVLNLNENKWYTLETQIDDNPYLAQYTNAWGFEMKEGRGSHYTNDFLWSPIGDPYGFQLFNRYMDINSGNDNRGESNKVITTEYFRENETSVPNNQASTAAGETYIHPVPDGVTIDGTTVIMGDYKTAQPVTVKPGQTAGNVPLATIQENSIYELLDGGITGYFYFHPVANTGQELYFNPVNGTDKDGAEHLYVRLCTTPTPFTFGLSKDLIKPYFDRAGYVGGLKKEVYNEHPDLAAAMKDRVEPTAAQLMEAQGLVYNYKENIVPFKTGYYRLHSPLGISDINPTRYVSGYTHAIERDQNGDNDETDAIPMHFYEENSERVRTFTDLKDGGFTESHATRGDLQILPVERDPASIFHFTAIYDNPEEPGTNVNPNPNYRNNLSYISTQGLYVRGKVAKGNSEEGHSDFNGSLPRAAAVMTNHALPNDPVNPGADDPTPLFVMDIGGGILLIHDNKTEGGRVNLKYFCYDHQYDEEGKPTVYDMKMTHNTHTDHAKFCMQPVQDTSTKGVNEMGLKLNLNKGGDDYYYASFCAPYDVLLTDADNDAAFICLVWDTEMLHLKKVGKYNAAPYKDNNQFVPAGTPVIIRSTKTSVTMALPTTTPTASLTQGIFTGQYLEQLLAEKNAGTNASNNDVYSFGLPYKGTITKSANYYNEHSDDNGRITLSLAQTEETGIGFYINANPNREGGGAMGLWIPNNRYVYNNKAYIRNPGVASARRDNLEDEPTFIPVCFDDDEDEPIADSLKPGPMNGRVYDLQGRCVVTEQEVREGNWYSSLRPGIYILNGKKFKR